MSPGRKHLKYLLAAVGVLAVAAYWEVITKVIVINESAGPLAHVEIGEESGKVLWAGDLRPGEHAWIWKLLTDPSRVAVSFDQGGERRHWRLGYPGVPLFTGSAIVRVRNDRTDITEIPTVLTVGAGLAYRP